MNKLMRRILRIYESTLVLSTLIDTYVIWPSLLYSFETKSSTLLSADLSDFLQHLMEIKYRKILYMQNNAINGESRTKD